jgi:glycosyltransferase involved in cell wall biosynthesis
MKQPHIAVIVTTRNNHETLDSCLRSIKEQSYSSIELIVVDNNSTDDTKAIAQRYTTSVFNQGPERSTQRNFGVQQTNAEYVLIIDSDMELSEHVVRGCVEKVQHNPELKALIIPEESFGTGFWAQCKRLERSFYVGIDSIESARFFDRKTYEQVGGYNEHMVGGEDWDLSRRVGSVAPIGRIDRYIFHNEGHLRFTRTVRKMYYYAQHATVYFQHNPTDSALTDTSGPLERYKLFFSHPAKLLRHPALGIGMLTLKTAEYASGGLGLVTSRKQQTEDDQ